MSSCDFTPLSKVNISTKYLITGFIKHITKPILQDTNENIPSLIIAICILYLCHNERFTSFGNQIICDKTGNIISIRNNNHKNTAYGNIVIHNRPNSMYRWIIKIIQLDENGRISIGIDSSNKHCINFDFRSQINENNRFYGTSSDALSFGDGISNGYIGYCQGDIIEMELNTQQNILIFRTDRQTASIGNIDFNHQYNLAVSLTGSARVELMNFYQTIIPNLGAEHVEIQDSMDISDTDLEDLMNYISIDDMMEYIS